MRRASRLYVFSCVPWGFVCQRRIWSNLDVNIQVRSLDVWRICDCEARFSESKIFRSLCSHIETLYWSVSRLTSLEYSDLHYSLKVRQVRQVLHLIVQSGRYHSYKFCYCQLRFHKACYPACFRKSQSLL